MCFTIGSASFVFEQLLCLEGPPPSNTSLSLAHFAHSIDCYLSAMVDDGMFHLGAGLRALKARLKGELVVPADGTYQEAIGRWSRLAERPAAGVVFPQDETDIATTLAFAKESKVEIAVKGESSRRARSQRVMYYGVG